MLKVLRPSKNRQTQGYSDSHKGYDFSGKGDPNAYSSFFGVVTQSKNSETGNWVAGNRKLTTEDYGNYCKVRGQKDGKTYYQLLAHLEPGSVLSKGTEVKAGSVVGKIGNTGNSTAPHLHSEYRDEGDKNFPVSFVDEVEETNTGGSEVIDKKQQIIDAYLGARPNQPPSDDEINARLQENKNLVQILHDILTGDDKAREFWADKWELTPQEADTSWLEVIDNYKNTSLRLREILSKVGLTPGDDTEAVLGKVQWLIEQYTTLKAQKTPETIYKYQGKEYESIVKVGNLILILEKK